MAPRPHERVEKLLSTADLEMHLALHLGNLEMRFSGQLLKKLQIVRVFRH